MTNEQLAEFIKAGGNDELTPILWERVRKLLYVIADKYYKLHTNRCDRCGVTLWDLKQAAYTAYLYAVRAYDKDKGFQFNTYLNYQFKYAIRPMFSKDLLNTSESLNAAVGEDEETERIEFVADETVINDFERIYEESANAIVRNAFERLPGNLKTVIFVRYYKGLSVKEAARLLSIDKNEALNRERRALKLLRSDKALRKLALEYRRLGLL